MERDDPRELIERFFPHPNGDTVWIKISRWHWKSLSWLSDVRGITAGYIIHLIDHKYGSDYSDVSDRFSEFIEVCIQSAIEQEENSTLPIEGVDIHSTYKSNKPSANDE